MLTKSIVSAQEWLYRRSWLDNKYLNPDGSAHSRVFKLREKDHGELSVDIKSLTTADKAITDSSRFCLFELPNQTVERINLITYHDPLPNNNAHAVIMGMSMEDDISPSLLARSSKRVVLN